MPPLGQFVFACLAVFTAWTLIRASRSGRIFSRGIEFTVHEQPIVFSLVFAVHLVLVGFCVWCAFGYHPNDFFHAIGFPGF